MEEKIRFTLLMAVLMASVLSSCGGGKQGRASPQTGRNSTAAPTVFYSKNGALMIEETSGEGGERSFFLTPRGITGEYTKGSQVSEFEFVCAKGEQSKAKKLLKSAAFVGNPNMAPLHIAAMYNSADVAKFLIKEGVDVNMRGEGDNTTAIFWAALFDSRDVARLLIKAGASVNVGTNNDETPLMVTSYKDSAEMAELLIKAGANVNAKDSSGSTALMYADWNGATKVAAVLRKHGAK